MDYRRPERLEPLAAQYVLGTLRGRARARLTRLAQSDGVIAGAVREWEERLFPLLEALPPVTPPGRVWSAIVQRLQAARGEPVKRGFWSSLSFWRGLSVAALAATFALAIALLNPREEAATSYVAVLAGQDGKPVLVATAERAGRVLTLKPLAPQTIASDRALELWALPTTGNPRPLGFISASDVVRLALPPSEAGRLEAIPTLAVSLEPAGGSPTGLPTGPVLYTGALQRLY